MRLREQGILLSAGFRIFRMEEMSLRIKEIKTGGDWGTFGKYPSKAAMRRAWAELMNDTKNLEG